MKQFLSGILILGFLSQFGFAADKKITDLTLYPAASFTTSDVIPIVDIGADITKKTRILDLDVRYPKITAGAITTNLVGNVTGNLTGNVTGNADTATSAAKWTTARNLAGNSVDGSANVAFANKFIVQGTTDTGLSAAQFLGALGTGIVKNTTTTGVLSIAIAADFPTLNQNTSGTAADLSATLSIAHGGTSQTTKAAAFDALSPCTSNGIIAYGASTDSCVTTSIGNLGLPLVSNSSISAPAFQKLGLLGGGTNSDLSTTGGTSQVLKQTSVGGNISVAQLAFSDISGTASLTTQVAGILPVANGGTGLATLTAHSIQLGNGTSTPTQLAVPASGTLLTGVASSDPAFSATPTLGVNGTTNGTLALATNTGSGQSVVLQNLATTTSWNFNLPTTAGSSGQVLTSQGGGSTSMTWASAPAPVGVPAYNFLVNSALDYWQVGTSGTITAAGGGSPTNVYGYEADQWYVRNVLGGGTIEGIITFSQVTGVTSGSIFGGKVQITTAPNGTGIQNGTYLYQSLSTKASQPLANQFASFSILVKALGNVNSVTLTILAQSSEVKDGASQGSGNCTVNSSTFTLCTLNNIQLVGLGIGGVAAVSVNINGVSSGNLYALNNGFVVEQGMLNLGASAATYSRQFSDPAQELAACQFFYEKSYDITVNPGTNTGLDSAGAFVYRDSSVTSTNPIIRLNQNFKVAKRVGPTITAYSTDGTSARVRDRTNSSNLTPAFANTGMNQFSIEFQPSAVGTAIFVEGHWTADSRL